MSSYAELQVTSNFSFLRGGSHPPELVLRAHELGLAAIAITDRNTLAGVVRAHAAAKEIGLRFVVGARLDFRDGPSVLAFPTDRAAYGRLSALLTTGKRRAPKGQCHLRVADLLGVGDGLRLVALAPERLDAAYGQHLLRLADRFPGAVDLAAHCLHRADDARRLALLGALADWAKLPLLATNEVLAHGAERRALLDVLTCVREGCTLAEAGLRLGANAERHLKSAEEMARLFRERPDALARTVELAGLCRFSLDDLDYEYPAELPEEGVGPQQKLEQLAWRHAGERYGSAIPEGIRALLEKELALIARLDYARYFLTVYDIVRFARERRILCQGRGSAANSALCFVLGITAVDPARTELLFERFVSAERREPPDIDLDFEHERREEVIQYVYAKYGRDHAGIVGAVTTYGPRSALRDVGKALGLSGETIARIGVAANEAASGVLDEAALRRAGLAPEDAGVRRTLALAAALVGFPRHLSQHSGGFVIARSALSSLVPIENAAMAGRTAVEWDKDDLADLGMLKIDLLGLGVLTSLQKGLELLRIHYGVERELHEIADEDRQVYEMLCRGDAIGVFQVETRAQLAMLPRLRPRRFEDLVAQVAIVRPGPIRGDMVHPYLRRRNGAESIELPTEALRRLLGRTHGVPLFQEQVMRLAIEVAGFTPAEANRLRRAVSGARQESLAALRSRFVEGMVAGGCERSLAARWFEQIEGFGTYAFPESHAASFALITYASAWLKCHYPAVFACALLNCQPMGFYAPAQLVRDAEMHGVRVLPVDVAHSDWDCTLEPDGAGFALRLGFRQISGFRREEARRLIEARRRGDGPTMQRLWGEAGVAKAAIEKLADADAWSSCGLGRRAAQWAAKGLVDPRLPLFHAEAERRQIALPAMSRGEEVREDYHHLQLSLKQHPAALLREQLTKREIVPAACLATLAARRSIKVAGLVIDRHRPETKSGVLFLTLEDETGIVSTVIRARVFARCRRAVLGGQLLEVEGHVERDESGRVAQLVAEQVTDLSPELDRVTTAGA
jgi:error-prone DNA polymerase